MNKVNVDLSLNAQGYQQGLDQATQSTAAYETEVRKIQDATINFNKELAKAKKEAKNLAASYAMLSKEAKQSQFGKEMKQQLDEAKEKAAEYIDIQSDLNEELKNMASDTKVFDQLTAGLDIFMNTASAAAGTIATLTGREEDARRAITMFTTAQSTLNAVTKIGTALQKQSNLMLGVAAIQKKAAAVATNLQTSATVGATAAQKAFNFVANMNPYVLLATAAITAVGAVTAFIMATNKAETAQEKLQREMHEASMQGQKDAQKDVVHLDLVYAATQNVNLKMEDRLAAVKKIKSEYPGYFKNLSNEAILTGQAADAYKRLRENIIAAAQARAYEKKITEAAEEGIDLEEQIEKQKKLIEEREATKRRNQGAVMPGMTSAGAMAGEDWSIQSAKNTLADLEKQQQENTNRMEAYRDKIAELTPQVNDLEEALDDTSKTAGGAADKINASANSIAYLENKISDLQEKAKNGVLPDEFKDPAKYKAQIEAWQKELKEVKIRWGFEEPETQLQKLQADVEAAKQKYILAVDTNDEQAKQAAYEAYQTAQQALNEYELKIKIEPIPDPSVAQKERAAIQKTVSDALKQPIEETFDFSGLSDESRKTAEKTLKYFEQIKSAREQLQEILENPDSSDAEIAAASKGLEDLADTYNNLAASVEKFNNEAKQMREAEKHYEDVKTKAEETGKTLSKFGSIAGSLGNIFKTAGDSMAAAMAQSVAATLDMVAQTLPQIMSLIGAKEAEAMASGTASAAKLPFPANLGAIASIMATIISTFATIYSAFKGAESHAGGGIVGGSSFAGDKIFTRLNSGEMVLNKRQQTNLFDMLDAGRLPGNATSVEVTGVIRGTDMVLLQKNTNKMLKKSGRNITF